MSFLDDKIQDDRPREGIKIELPTEAYQLATGTRDLTIAGERYVATPSARAEIQIAALDATSLEIRLVAQHAFVQRFMQKATPPRFARVTVYQQQMRSGSYEAIWSGRIVSVKFEKAEAVFVIDNETMTRAVRRLPLLTVQRSCSHILYDANCQVGRAGFKISTTVASESGRSIKVALVGVLGTENDWATGGEIVHVASGERMTILRQTADGTIVMQLPIGALRVGDAVDVYAGCNHTMDHCAEKFDNRVNFGGYPHLISLVLKPNGSGV